MNVSIIFVKGKDTRYNNKYQCISQKKDKPWKKKESISTLDATSTDKQNQGIVQVGEPPRSMTKRVY